MIWNEVRMQHYYCIEVVDRTLQDINDTNKLFEKIIIIEILGKFFILLFKIQKKTIIRIYKLIKNICLKDVSNKN